MKQKKHLLPLPDKTARTKLIQVSVEEPLYDAVDKQRRERKLSMREVCRWGLKAFLVQTAPQIARELGILAK